MEDDKLKIERARRLAKIRERAGFKKRSDAMRRFKYKGVYYHHENGRRLIDEKAAFRYARDFNANPLYLLWNRGKIDTPFKFDENAIAENDAVALDWGMVARHKSVVKAIQAIDTDNKIPPGAASKLLFKLVSCDNSMVAPGDPVQAFKIGNELIFDALAEWEAGDFVLATVFGEDAEVFRQLRIQETRPDGRKVYALVPLNPFFETKTIISGVTGEIIAKLVCAPIRF